MDDQKLQQMFDTLRKDFGELKAQMGALQQKTDQAHEALRKQISDATREQSDRTDERLAALEKDLKKKIRKEARDRTSSDRDRMAMLENQMYAHSAMNGGKGPEPVRYVPTGTGLIDPEWRWEREHRFRR